VGFAGVGRQVEVSGDDDLGQHPGGGQDGLQFVALAHGHVRVGGQVGGAARQAGPDNGGTGPGSDLVAGVLAVVPADVAVGAVVVVHHGHAEEFAVGAPVPVVGVAVHGGDEVDRDVVGAVQVGHGLGELAPAVRGVEVVAAGFLEGDEFRGVPVDESDRLVHGLAGRVAGVDRHAAVAEVHLQHGEGCCRSGGYGGGRRRRFGA